jgi:hypothetical protein
MGVKTIRVCDITGEPLVSPVRLGFKTNGEEIIFETDMSKAQQLMIAFASRLSNDELIEATEEVFGKNWIDELQKTQNSD